MNVSRIVLRELAYRKWNALWSVVAVAVAVACLVGELTIVRLHHEGTKAILARKKRESEALLEKQQRDYEKRWQEFRKDVHARLVSAKRKLEDRLAEEERRLKALLAKHQQAHKERMAKIEDDYRKIMRKLGFNVLIIPKNEKVGEMHARGYVKETMPEEYVNKLANSKIMTINHLLPMVQQMVKWKEQERTILLTGIRGEVPFAHRNPKKPLVQPVPKGSMVVGYELHQNLKLKKGDKVRFQGKEFTVHALQPERGNKDDITIWINLEEAQQLLGIHSKINAIMALECNCASVDRLGEVRKEIMAILPDTQVLEFQSKALARAEARNRAKQIALRELKEKQEEIAQTLALKQQQTRSAIQQEEERAEREKAAFQAEATAAIDEFRRNAENARQREAEQRATVHSRLVLLGFVLVPLVLVATAVWLALMALANVEQRRGEIGILRALGLSLRALYAIFIGRSAVVGFFGSLLGVAMGLAIGAAWMRFDTAALLVSAVFDVLLIVLSIVAAPAVTAAVGCVAAMFAARHDPAVILQQT